MANHKHDKVKEYFSRAFHLDASINSKLDQVVALRSQATKTTATLSDLPRSAPNPQKLECLLVKLFDLQNEITADIDTLVDTKREIIAAIKQLQRTEHQVLLEMRYLCYKPWADICMALGFEERHVFEVHGTALRAAEKIIFKDRSKTH